MSSTQTGILVGLALGAVAVFGGFLAFITVAVFAAVGWGVGLAIEGRLDVQSLLGRSSDRR